MFKADNASIRTYSCGLIYTTGNNILGAIIHKLHFNYAQLGKIYVLLSLLIIIHTCIHTCSCITLVKSHELFTLRSILSLQITQHIMEHLQHMQKYQNNIKYLYRFMRLQHFKHPQLSR